MSSSVLKQQVTEFCTPPLGQLHRHIWLTKEVAASVGVDLSAAMHSGDLDPRCYSQMVTKCRRGNCDRACALHLEKLKNRKQNEVQSFCPNKAAIDAMARWTREADQS